MVDMEQAWLLPAIPAAAFVLVALFHNYLPRQGDFIAVGASVLAFLGFLFVAAILFTLGIYGVLTRRNAVLILMSVELMLNAVAVNFVAFAVYTDGELFRGLIFAVFVIIVAAAEVGLALGIILRVFRSRATANVDEVSQLKW